MIKLIEQCRQIHSHKIRKKRKSELLIKEAGLEAKQNVFCSTGSPCAYTAELLGEVKKELELLQEDEKEK